MLFLPVIQSSLIALVISNPSRKLDELEQTFSENEEPVRMVQEAAGLARQSSEVLVRDLNYREVGSSKWDPNSGDHTWKVHCINKYK